MKIAVFSEQQEITYLIFDEVVSVVRTLRLQCEVKSFTNSILLKKQLNENVFSFDILVLDSNEKESFLISNIIRKKNFLCSIIFATVGTKINLNVFDYRPSGVVNLENNKQIKRAIIWSVQEQAKINPYFLIKNKEEIFRIPFQKIIWLESRQRTVTLHSDERDIIFYAKLSDVYERLPEHSFLRCHQSFIVNVDKIILVNKVQHTILLQDGTELEVSKSYYPGVIDFINHLNI